MSVGNNNLLLPVLLFLDFLLLHLLDHVVARDEDSFEELVIGKGRRASEVCEEVYLALALSKSVGGATCFNGSHLFLHLLDIGDLQIVQD